MKNYNIIDKREWHFRDSEMDYIERKLPDTIINDGKEKELCISKDVFGDNEDTLYMIWYGEIKDGDFLAEDVTLERTVKKMVKYINSFKDSFIKRMINKLKGVK